MADWFGRYMICLSFYILTLKIIYTVPFLVPPDVPLPPLFPSPCSVEWLVSHHLDINSVPRRSFFELLKYHADDEMEREKLEEFCTAQGQVKKIKIICLFVCCNVIIFYSLVKTWWPGVDKLFGGHQFIL